MGLLGKALGAVAKKALDIAVDNGAIDKVLQSENVQKTIKNASNKLNKAIGMKEETDALLEMPYQYKYIIRQQETSSVDLIFGEVLERDTYILFDKENNTEFIVKGTVLMGKHHFIMKNSNAKEVGRIKKALVNIPIPFEKEAKSCSIIINDTHYCDVSTCVSFGERDYSLSYSDLHINFDKFEKEFKIYKGKSKELICQINKTFSSDVTHRDKYVVGINSLEYKIPMLLIAIGIDLVRYY